MVSLCLGNLVVAALVRGVVAVALLRVVATLVRAMVVPHWWKGLFLVKNFTILRLLVVLVRSRLVTLARCVVTWCSSVLMPSELLLITVCAWLGLARDMWATLS